MPGEIATVGNVYWPAETETLSYVAELRQRTGGQRVDDMDVVDYGSNFGIDPAVKLCDRVRYISLGDNAGIWTFAGNEFHFERL